KRMPAKQPQHLTSRLHEIQTKQKKHSLNQLNKTIQIHVYPFMRYAISDIHGNRRSFEALLDQIAFSESDTLYLLGDYIDRGPDAKGVFDLIFRLREQGYQIEALLGNHEDMMLDAREGRPKDLDIWLVNGGTQTLKSFPKPYLKAVDERYWQFMEQLPTILEVDNFILVHAGLNFKKEQPLKEETGHLWARKWYHSIDYKWLGDRIIVHGHTTEERNNILRMRDHLDQLRYIDIDNGCYRYDNPKKGHLCAFNLDTRELTFQKNIDVFWTD
ncbi:MAG: metallophosphoesterase family protein, partial [Bacteroidota bacterium]